LAYSATNRAYHETEIALLNTMRNFENGTEDDTNCELDHPSQNIDTTKPRSAAAVLALCKPA
jgi:hypothetical protein